MWRKNAKILKESERREGNSVLGAYFMHKIHRIRLLFHDELNQMNSQQIHKFIYALKLCCTRRKRPRAGFLQILGSFLQFEKRLRLLAKPLNEA